MRHAEDLTDRELLLELLCRMARIEDALEIDEEQEPIPERIRDNMREQMYSPMCAGIARLCSLDVREVE